MDDYKWFKDDFENNIDSAKSQSNASSGESTSSSYTYNSYNTQDSGNYNYSQSQGADFNTSGADYQSASAYNTYTADTDATFYNTNIKKKKKRRVPLYAAAIAVVLTAAISVSGAVYGPKLVAKLQDSVSFGEQKQTADSKKPTKGSAIVAQAVADSEGNKALTTPEIVDKVGPAVVGIINTADVPSYGFGFGFYGNGGTTEQQSSGSGVIISEDGYIVTNNHVIEGANSLTVILNTGDEYSAKLIGRDSRTDLAVLKVDAENLIFAQFGKSSDLRVGDTAIAIGNPLGQEFAGTTTQGIISGLNRSVTIDNKTLNLIQTDAAINPGNSGGALVNAYGHLIGINTAKISSDTLEGLGFAIPIDEAKPIISDLIDSGYVTGRPIIGIGGRAVTEEDAEAYNLKVGVYVSSMTPDSPAYMAGVKIGDIIVECDGKKVTTVEEINEIKNKMQPGDEMKIKVYRQGKYRDITLVLGEEIPSAE